MALFLNYNHKLAMEGYIHMSHMSHTAHIRETYHKANSHITSSPPTDGVLPSDTAAGVGEAHQGGGCLADPEGYTIRCGIVTNGHLSWIIIVSHVMPVKPC